MRTVARQVYLGFSEDPTEGALWYHSDSVMPSWGKVLPRGQRIGLSGGQPGAYGAGNTTDPHLHFELWEGTPFASQRLDPADYITFAEPEGIDWAWWGSLLTPGLYLTGGTLLAIAIGRRIGKRRR